MAFWLMKSPYFPYMYYAEVRTSDESVMNYVALLLDDAGQPWARF